MKDDYEYPWFWLALTLIFITLKLTHYINWSWGWVILPIFIPIIEAVLAIAVMFLLAWGRELYDSCFWKKK